MSRLEILGQILSLIGLQYFHSSTPSGSTLDSWLRYQKRIIQKKTWIDSIFNAFVLIFFTGSRELAGLLTPAIPKPKPDYKVRSMHEEMKVKYDFLIRGIDDEDIRFLKRRYEELLQVRYTHKNKTNSQ